MKRIALALGATVLAACTTAPPPAADKRPRWTHQTVIDELNAWFFGVPQGLGLGQIDWGLFGQFYAPTALPVDVNIVGLDCNPTEQQSKIKSVIAGLFDGLCPGTTICRRMFDAALVPIVGASLDFVS